MVAFNSGLRADQLEIYLGTGGVIPLAQLRSFFFQMERIAQRDELFGGSIQFALREAHPGSLRLILDLQRRFRNRTVRLEREAQARLQHEEQRVFGLQERIAVAAERSADADDRTAKASERTARATEKILLATVAAVLVPVLAEEIRFGSLAAPTVKIDKSFDVTEIHISSASNAIELWEDDLPNSDDVRRYKNRMNPQKVSEKFEETLRLDRAVDEGEALPLAGTFREVNGKLVFLSMNGNRLTVVGDPPKRLARQSFAISARVGRGSQGLEIEILDLITPLSNL